VRCFRGLVLLLIKLIHKCLKSYKMLRNDQWSLRGLDLNSPNFIFGDHYYFCGGLVNVYGRGLRLRMERESKSKLIFQSGFTKWLNGFKSLYPYFDDRVLNGCSKSVLFSIHSHLHITILNERARKLEWFVAKIKDEGQPPECLFRL